MRTPWLVLSPQPTVLMAPIYTMVSNLPMESRKSRANSSAQKEEWCDESRFLGFFGPGINPP